MANTLDADLIMDGLSMSVINVLSNRFAPMMAFSRRFTPAAIPNISQTKNLRIPKVTSTASTQKNPTSFTGGDSVTSDVAVTVDHYSKTINLSTLGINQGFELPMFATAAANQFCDDIMAVVTGKLLDADIVPANEVVAQASFAAANAASIWGKIGKTSEKHLILDSVAYAKLAPADKNSLGYSQGAYGFNGIHHQTMWTGATANTYGIGCGPEFMAVYAAIPQMSESVRRTLTDQRIVTLEKLGLSVQINYWADAATRTEYASYDIMFGAAVADGNAAVLILSA